MAITQQLHIDDTHDALVRFLQFSPDGKSLVTSSWDRKSFILHVGDSKFLHERTLAHPPGPGFMNQLEWSPEGDKLLMRRSRCVTVWNRVGECICNHQQSPTDHPVRSVAWLTNEEGSKVVVMDTKGEELRHYRVDNLLLRDIVITSDKTWMVCVGTHDDDKSPRKKNQIILYNLVARRIIKRSLVYHEICDITLACDGRSALVSYENKAPSQLWELVLQRNNQDLVLRHTYMPKVPTTFAGLPSIFGGSHDQLILRASTAGDIYVWDRDSATLLHQIHVPTRLGHLTSFAWNRAASDSWMFVTGSHEGAVYIWTTPTDEVPRVVVPAPTRLDSRFHVSKFATLGFISSRNYLYLWVWGPHGESVGARDVR
ncbi:hypothetical protein EW026_g3637 [Hermanssonia centrifuga]|uniref:WD40 repeat-like protein n=1 Tax=Hermanssonia centrifuga TaxID=98765 RepID=A0A4S4KKK3_9APHY|nr:hypothetical protein EW026_g3637 [Hermanssonia centrifuga]